MVKPANALELGAGFPPTNSDWIDVSTMRGATWTTVAAEVSRRTGVTATGGQLIQHNFQLSPGEPDYQAKVNYYLSHLLGCKTSADGKYFIFEGATNGKLYYPKETAADATHVIIIGGVSVNEPGHDKYPFNFIDPALRRGQGYGRNVQYIFFAPSYEERVRGQKNEYPWIWWNTRPTDGCAKDSTWHKVWHTEPDKWEKDPDHFLIYVRQQAKSHRGVVTPIRTAADLTAALNKVPRIASIDYYGHSDANSMFLDFGIDGTFASKQVWGKKQAVGLPAIKFIRWAVFSSFGCKQGQDDALAEQLRDLWKIRTIGAEGKTDYVAIGKDKTTMFPDAPGGYYQYFEPSARLKDRVKIEKSDLAKPVKVAPGTP
jgi:hypothetical protein